MKTKYDEIVEPNLPMIEAWARDGIPEEKMAEKLGIAYSTFRRYKESSSALSAALYKTKEIVDNVEMVNAYKKRAEGYDVEEPTYTYKYVLDHKTGEYKEVLVKKEVRIRHVPGDARAMENWLRLRQRQTWGEINRTEIVDVTEGGVVLLPDRKEIGDGEEGTEMD